MTNRTWAALGAIAAVVLIFQFFFRYQYIHQNAAVTMRVDRLTQATCIMPCIPTPPPTPTPKPTPEDLTTTDSRAIELARTLASDANYIQAQNPQNNWKIVNRYTNAHESENPFIRTNVKYPIREVCYCDTKGSGWYYEVHLDTGTVLTILGNDTLMQLYGISRTK